VLAVVVACSVVAFGPVLSADAVSAGAQSPVSEAGLVSPGVRVALVRPGMPLGCGYLGPVGSTAPAIFVPNCPPPACAFTPTPTSGKHARSSPTRTCRFTSDQIYVTGPDGLSPHRITRGPDNHYEPAWAPDGERIAYVDNGRLVVARADGTDIQTLVSGSPSMRPSVSWPAWSPDSSQIVFSQSDPTGDPSQPPQFGEALFAISADGAALRQLTADPANVNDHSPAFSPDGAQIAYAQWINNNATDSGSIWVMNANGSNAHPVAEVSGYPTGLCWSPDGHRLTFASNSHPFVAPHTTGVYVLDTANGEVQQITGQSDTYVTSLFLERPTWSSDGQTIFFTAQMGSPTNTSAVYAISPDGTDGHLALTEPWTIWQADWEQ
jgi:WD40-like Beta Propeller Repeat